MKKHKQKYEDKYEYLSIAESIINTKNEQGDKHFFCYADIDEEKVYGAFSKQDFENAVNHFIQQNYTNIINPLLKARDERGKPIHNPQSAIAEVKKRLMNFRR